MLLWMGRFSLIQVSGFERSREVPNDVSQAKAFCWYVSARSRGMAFLTTA